MTAESKRAVVIGAVPLDLPDGKYELALQMQDPGIVRHVGWTLRPKLVMGRSGQPQFDEVLTMFVQYTPNSPLRNRRFCVLATDRGVQFPDGHDLVYVGSAVSSNTPQIAHVFEVVESSKVQPFAINRPRGTA